jgi:hypothetical protein
MSQELAAAVGSVMKAMPGSKLTTVDTKRPPLGEGEPCAIYLRFGDGSVERYRGNDPAPREDGRNRTSESAGVPRHEDR